MKNTYYIKTQGFLGNAFLWWPKSNAGYTSDIREARRFTKEEAKRIAGGNPKFDVYKCEDIDQNTEAHKLVIDSQYVPLDQIVSFG